MNNAVLSAKRLLTAAAFRASNVVGFNKNTVSVLGYHSISNEQWPYAVSLEEFIKQLDIVRTSSGFLEAKDVISALKPNKKIKSGVLITIDDGYKDVLSIVPYAKTHSIKPLLFVMAHPEKANRRELQFRGTLLTTSDLKFLIRNGWEIGCHSATHADFSKLNDSEIAFEVAHAKKTLEKKLGIRIDYFAYPKGFTSMRIQNAVQKAGYAAAFGIDAGCVTPTSSCWNIPRTIIQSMHRSYEFPAIYSQSTYLVRKIVDQTVGRFLHV